MKEFLEGRRFGFALRPQLGHIALGLAIGVTLLDLMAWFGWGARDTNGFVIADAWLAAGGDRALARLDVVAAVVVLLLYAASAALRSTDLAAAGASPGAVVSAFAGLVVLLVDGVIASTLYSSREWAILDEEEYEPRRHQKRRRAS